MRSRQAISLAVVALFLVVTSARATPVALADGPGPGYFASDNVEFVAHVPLNNDSAGGKVVGDYFYITSSRALNIYDISDPVAPALVGVLPLLQDPYFAEEDPDTNGSILLVGAGGTLNVIDVEDKSNPQIIGTLDGADAHTVTCVLDCKWAYNSDGKIIDLRDPTAPKVAGDWKEGTAVGGGHDVTEVAPGRIVTSTNPLLYLDARKNPAKPRVLGSSIPLDGRYVHGNEWPRNATDRFLLVGGESGAGTCDSEGSSGSLMTFDAAAFKRTRTFRMIDEYIMGTGLATEGKMPAVLYCGHWFDVHPRYRNGGVVAMAWYENGTHFFDVSSKGKIEHIGYFLPAAGSTSAEYWITDEILYTVDYNRGIDIIRFTGKT
ncbi:MAG: hypothetical protein M3161_03545 [Actinomycetota bacterium]|nr:hypothetical protein [Actinomycetota bacterium]